MPTKTRDTRASHEVARVKPYRVLLVDADPQHNLTTFVGDPNAKINLADVLLDPSLVRTAIQRSRAGGADILNGAREIAIAQDDLKIRHKTPYTVLRKILDTIRDDYDFIFVDCARTMDLMSVSALAAATEILSPIDCDPMAVGGLGQIRTSLAELAELDLLRGTPPIRVVLTKYPGGKEQPVVVRETIQYVRDLDVPVLKSVIRYSEQSRGAWPQQQTMFVLYPRSITSQDYWALRNEFVATIGPGPHTIIVALEKGGVMKTYTVAHLAHALTLDAPPSAGSAA